MRRLLSAVACCWLCIALAATAHAQVQTKTKPRRLPNGRILTRVLPNSGRIQLSDLAALVQSYKAEVQHITEAIEGQVTEAQNIEARARLSCLRNRLTQAKNKRAISNEGAARFEAARVQGDEFAGLRHFTTIELAYIGAQDIKAQAAACAEIQMDNTSRTPLAPPGGGARGPSSPTPANPNAPERLPAASPFT